MAVPLERPFVAARPAHFYGVKPCFVKPRRRGQERQVGFYPIDRVTILQEQFGQQPCAGADIGHNLRGRETTFGFQQIHDLGRIVGPVAKIIFDNT